MSCRENARLLRDVAAGGRFPAVLRSHLEGCDECRTVLDGERSLLDRIDATLRDGLAVEPSVALARRVRQLPEAARSPRYLPAWLLAAAALIAVTSILIVRLSQRAAPVVRHEATSVPLPGPAATVATRPETRLVPGPSTTVPRVRPPRAPRAVEPPVIVAADERESLLRYYAALQRPVKLALDAPEGREAAILQPLVISPLRFPALGEESSPTEGAAPTGNDNSIESGGLR